MFTKVIIGDDGAAGGREAIALARALAPTAELVLAGTYAYDERPGRDALAGYGRLLHDDVEAALVRSRAEAGVPAARIVAIPDTSPARGLHRLAAQEGADLIAVGSSRLGAVGRILLGDVARGVLHGSPCPVAVAPRDGEARSPAVIGVAYDDSEEARAALPVAAALAGDHGARLAVRYVVEDDIVPAFVASPLSALGAIYEDIRAEAQARIESVTAELGVPVECAAVIGRLAPRLAELAAEVDLMVCGSRGWGPVRRVVLGSTADRLVHHAPCPVLVVPRTAVPAPVTPTPAAGAAA